MPNSLTRQAGLKLGPLFLETLVKHYLDRIRKSAGASAIPLRQDELLYDEVFIIVKKFLEASTKHTVEELQSFSNTRTPSPPWVHSVRLIVPSSCCDEAAKHLITAFGGEESMKRTVGGTKWWQVRGVSGVDAEWITAKKDWQEAKRREKERRKRSRSRSGKDKTDAEKKESSEDDAGYQPEMDEMPCILYSHGGGYYFGSIDQERYSMQRYARKIHGRVFAVNYRLAPQYPFPCAIQDLLAAYLFLIRPPEGAAHKPVSPGRIVVAGDSAGGGLSLALLQVIRDADLPVPAGGVLISPWCDFTHSFPSIFSNTDSDVIPTTGLSLHKPSALWPPPSEDMTVRVRDRLRDNLWHALHSRSKRPGGGLDALNTSAAPSGAPRPLSILSHSLPSTSGPIHIGSTASLPPSGSLSDQSVSLITPEGERITIAEQLQLYAPNGLLKHPLVSPALSYLGGLPPLFFIASDREVLRDEVIYAAHRAANPDGFPLTDEVRAMYPALEGIESRCGPTPVHLQVYDDAAHVLPVLFSFTTPAKYCYRAIATFCKHVTRVDPTPLSPITPSPFYTQTPDEFILDDVQSARSQPASPGVHTIITPSSPVDPQGTGVSIKKADTLPSNFKNGSQREKSRLYKTSFSSGLARTASTLRSRSFQSVRGESGAFPEPNASSTGTSSKGGSVDVAGPRLGHSTSPPHDKELYAGNYEVYDGTWAISVSNNDMIRERVSTQGAIRPLESEDKLPALQVPPELIGTLSEKAIRRYTSGKEKFDRKFAGAMKNIAKHRARNLEVAKKDASMHIARLQHYLEQDGPSEKSAKNNRHSVAQGLFNSSASWGLAWALDSDEHPPPSSIVARRDTEEAIQLARVADRGLVAEESAVTANNLWSVVVNFLTVTPENGGVRMGPSRVRPAFGAWTGKRKRHSKFVPFWRIGKDSKEAPRQNREKENAEGKETLPV